MLKRGDKEVANERKFQQELPDCWLNPTKCHIPAHTLEQKKSESEQKKFSPFMIEKLTRKNVNTATRCRWRTGNTHPHRVYEMDIRHMVQKESSLLSIIKLVCSLILLGPEPPFTGVTAKAMNEWPVPLTIVFQIFHVTCKQLKIRARSHRASHTKRRKSDIRISPQKSFLLHRDQHKFGFQPSLSEILRDHTENGV